MKLILKFYVNITSFDIFIIPGKGNINIKYKNGIKMAYPDPRNSYPSENSQIIKIKPNLWEMTVRVHVLKFKGNFYISKTLKGTSINFIGQQNDRANFNLSSIIIMDHPIWSKFPK